MSSYEWYVRDASGNTMAVYNQSTAGVLTQREVNLYGSTLIGVQKRNIDADAAMLNLSAVGQRGMKQYFLGNHLGNTLSVISDKKYAAVITGGVVTAYKPDVLSATDYSSFGVSLLGRQFNTSSTEYGFNGKWNEVETGYQNYGMRDYSRLGRRFTSVDPITGKYPWLTPFQFASNRPIDGVDLDGLEFKTQTAYNAYWHVAPAAPSIPKPQPTTPVTHISLNNVQPTRSDNTQAQQKQFFVPTPQQFRAREEILVFDPYKQIGIIGPAPIVRDNLAISKQQYYNAVGDNIASSPAGALGYKMYGDIGSFYGGAVGDIVFSLGGVPGEGFLSKNKVNVTAIADVPEAFTPPKIVKNYRGEFTNGKYTVSDIGMMPHTNGDNSTGKSQFLFNVDASKAALDAAAYADQNNLWNAQNTAKVPVSNGNVGVLGRGGELTNYINVYRTNTNYIHASPGTPPEKKTQ